MNKEIIIKGVVALALVIALYLLLRSFGVFKSKEEKQADELKASGVGGTSTGGQIETDGKTSAQVLAMTNAEKIKAYKKLNPTFDNWFKWSEEIYNSKGFFHDTEDTVIAIFRQFHTQDEVNNFAKYFFIAKKRDLISYLDTFLDDEDLATIMGIIKSLPLSIKTTKKK